MYLTRKEAATHARRSPELIWKACMEYQRSNGKRGLRHAQQRPNTRIYISIDDLERWMHGKPPIAERLAS